MSDRERLPCSFCGSLELGSSPTGDWCNTCGAASPGFWCPFCDREGVNATHWQPDRTPCPNEASIPEHAPRPA